MKDPNPVVAAFSATTLTREQFEHFKKQNGLGQLTHVDNETSAHTAGWMLGVNHVLRLLEKEFVR